MRLCNRRSGYSPRNCRGVRHSPLPLPYEVRDGGEALLTRPPEDAQRREDRRRDERVLILVDGGWAGCHGDLMRRQGQDAGRRRKEGGQRKEDGVNGTRRLSEEAERCGAA